MGQCIAKKVTIDSIVRLPKIDIIGISAFICRYFAAGVHFGALGGTYPIKSHREAVLKMKLGLEPGTSSFTSETLYSTELFQLAGNIKFLWDCKYLKIFFKQQFSKFSHFLLYSRKTNPIMITFLVCLALLVAAYFTYGRYLERLAGPMQGVLVPSGRVVRRRGLYSDADVEDFPRPTAQYRRSGADFGGAVLGAAYSPWRFSGSRSAGFSWARPMTLSPA